LRCSTCDGEVVGDTDQVVDPHNDETPREHRGHGHGHGDAKPELVAGGGYLTIDNTRNSEYGQYNSDNIANAYGVVDKEQGDEDVPMRRRPSRRCRRGSCRTRRAWATRSS